MAIKQAGKIAIVVIAGFMLTAIAQAQTATQNPLPNAPQAPPGKAPLTSEERVDRHVAMLKDKLKLSDDQVTKVRAVLQDEQKQAMTDRDKFKGDRDAMRKAMEARRKATDDKIKAILTPDQQKQYGKVKDDLRKQRRDRPDPGDQPGSGRPGGRRGGW